VFRNRLLNPLDSRLRLRAGALSTVQPAAAVLHRWTQAERPAPRLRSAPGRRGEVAGRVAVLQSAAVHTIRFYFHYFFPLFMGCTRKFVHTY
jgi:hypothetical protein